MGVAYDTSFHKNQSQTSFGLPNGDTWRLGADVQHAVSPKGDVGFAVEYARSQSRSDPSGLFSGRYDHPTMFFMSAILQPPVVKESAGSRAVRSEARSALRRFCF